MPLSTVTWRQALAALVATVVALFSVVVVLRADGLPAVNALAARATGWFVHQPTGRVVLVDGYRGVALGSIDANAPGQQLSVAEGAPGAYVLNDSTAEARAIDAVGMRLGTPFGLTALSGGQVTASVGQTGLVVVNTDGEATVAPTDGEPVAFAVDGGSSARIGRDGAIWSIVDGDLVRTTSSGADTEQLGVPGAVLSTVGSEPLVVDAANRRARLGSGSWQDLPTDADPSEIVVQAAGPSATCGWLAADDDVWCVGHSGIEESATIDGLDVDGGDMLAIAGDVAALVRRGPSEIVRFDWRAGEIVDDLPISVAADAQLVVTATVDLVWVDHVAGDFVWALNPWGAAAIHKNPDGILVLGENGQVVEQGESRGSTIAPQDRVASEPEIREPDDNGIDDPPVAVDDPVTARSGSSVPVEVTANDYDPDGEAIAVSAVGVPGHGSVDIGTASTVVYTPTPGFVGVDRFDYTIVDGNGTTATATVIVELLAPGTTNSAPRGVPDTAQTGAGVATIVDVLLNDIDPERDALRIGGFSPPDALGAGTIGEVTETIGPSGLPALRFEPAPGFEGTAVFSYRPIDALAAVGEDVEVRVEVAREGDPNRPPVARPDAVRVRRNVPTPVTVLVNDVDPDGDLMTLSIVEPLPGGIEVAVQGDRLEVIARAGAADLVPFEYEVDDLNGHVSRSSVLVAVIDDLEPNRPPVVTGDTDKVVVGTSVLIDVTDNDTDPDGDPLTVVAVTQPDDDAGQALVFSGRQVQFTPARLSDDDAQATARLTYTVTDGNGHQVVGDVTVTVLPEPLGEPPFARDDSTFTFMNIPVTIDVLRNDGDPSGGRPTIVGRPGCPSGGLATVTTDSQVRFDPPANQTGAFRCTYEVTNATGRRASASIIVSVREPLVTNQPPVAVNDNLTVEVGGTGTIDVIANDSDPDGSNRALTLVSSTAPTLGSAVRNGNLITFTAGSETGIATINYQVADAAGAVSLGRLLVRVTEPQNRPPIAVDDRQTVFAPASPQQFSVLANDSDPDQTPGGLSVVSASRLSGDGTVSVSGNTVTITPASGFLGQIVATYTMRDGGGLTATASVILDVQRPPNRPPDARDDSAEVVSGGTVSVPVLFNDTDPDGDPLSVSIVSHPDSSLGSAALGDGRSVVFTSQPGASGTAIIVYEVRDGSESDTAVVRITVLPCGDAAPVADNGFLETGYMQQIAVNLSTFGRNGAIVGVSGPPGFDGNVYTPPAGENGNVTISYSVVNSCRMRARGTVTIDVNQDPIARPKTVPVFRGSSTSVPVSDLASDREPLTIADVSGAPAWVGVDPSGLTVAPGLDVAAGDHTFTVRVVDPGGLWANVDVTVAVRNRPPVAQPDTIDASAGAAVSVDLVANDTDPAGIGGLVIHDSPPTTIVFTNGGVGTVTVGADRRTVTVVAGTGQGTATFSYTIRNGAGDVSAPATVTVTGPAPPPPPTTTTPPPTTTTG